MLKFVLLVESYEVANIGNTDILIELKQNKYSLNFIFRYTNRYQSSIEIKLCGPKCTIFCAWAMIAQKHITSNLDNLKHLFWQKDMLGLNNAMVRQNGCDIKSKKINSRNDESYVKKRPKKTINK